MVPYVCVKNEVDLVPLACEDDLLKGKSVFGVFDQVRLHYG